MNYFEQMGIEQRKNISKSLFIIHNFNSENEIMSVKMSESTSCLKFEVTFVDSFFIENVVHCTVLLAGFGQIKL